MRVFRRLDGKYRYLSAKLGATSFWGTIALYNDPMMDRPSGVWCRGGRDPAGDDFTRDYGVLPSLWRVRRPSASAIATWTALLLRNEPEVGRVVRDAIREGEVTRKDLWSTSKLWCNAHGKKNVGPAIRKSLSDLGLDYLDMYMVHWPVALKPSTPSPTRAQTSRRRRKRRCRTRAARWRPCTRKA